MKIGEPAPLVSVIVPAFNEEFFLARSLATLRAQSYERFELIVVDNASTDATNEIARRFTQSVYLENEKGYISAVMRGARESKGSLICVCDADTLYPQTWLAKMVKALQADPYASAVYGSCVTHDASPVGNRINGFTYTQFLRFSRILGLDNTSGFNLLIRRAAFDAAGGYDPRYASMSPDIELGRRLSRVGRIIFRPDIKVEASFRRYRQRGVVRTQMMFINSWWRMLRGNTPTTSYEEYNSEIR